MVEKNFEMFGLKDRPKYHKGFFKDPGRCKSFRGANTNAKSRNMEIALKT